MKRIFLVLLVLFGALGLGACTDTAEATVESLVIVTPITKDEYVIDDELDLAGLEVKAMMSDGTEKVLTSDDFVITGFASATVGLKTLTLAYGDKSVTFTVTVFDPDADKELLYIQVLERPDKQIYVISEDFDTTGLVVEAVYNNGDKEIVTDYAVSGFNSAALNETGIVTLTWETKIAFVPYKIRPVIVQGITDTTITVGNAAATSGY
ncbi:MAG: bacterial Ig-like domain-containing protein, partial [Acholeplasmataceae bacterium]|nr:bacterial Ig-like domain-containing protein [Acholeplasmataceae bacterium]